MSCLNLKQDVKESSACGESNQKDDSLMDIKESDEEMADHLQSKEYKYMAHMLQQANNKHQQLQVCFLFVVNIVN